MSNQTDYEQLITEIMAIPNDSIKKPYMPMLNYIEEAEGLCRTSRKDLEKLAAAGLAEDFINDTAARAGACREAQTRWGNELEQKKDAQLEWKGTQEMAYELRDRLLHVFRFAFRNDPVLLKRVREIDEGSSHADMVQDLNDLADLGKKFSQYFQSFDFDPAELDKAAEMSDKVGELLAIANGERREYSEAKLIRDKAYTYLNEAVEEIRQCGKYIFWKDARKLAMYASDYQRKLRKS